jgi:hypothetical protein
MENENPFIRFLIDNELIFADLSIKDISEPKDLKYKIDSRDDAYFKIRDNSKAFIGLCMLLLRHYITNDSENLSKHCEELLKELEKCGLRNSMDVSLIMDELSEMI